MLTIAQAASAAYYLSHMESFRSPFDYYNGGDEPDGRWWNPSGLFNLEDGDDIESSAFQNLYAGRDPFSGRALVRNAGGEGRSPGIDLTFSADKSVSALWAIADPELRSAIESCHDDAVRWTLRNLVLKYCAHTRRGAGGSEVVPGDLLAATFAHHTSRENDPQLHTHSVVFNLVRTHDDGRWRALHQRPLYQWVRAGGAMYRHALSWNLRERVGLELERYGDEREFVRIAGMPEELVRAWSTRRQSIEKLAGKLGFATAETPALSQAITLATRPRKDVMDPEKRHEDWRAEAARHVDCGELIERLLSASPARAPQPEVRALIERCRALPAKLTHDEAVFTLPRLIEHIAREAPGLVSPEGLETVLARVLRDNSILALDGHRVGSEADARAGLAHTRLFSTIGYAAEEHAVREAALRSKARTGHAVSAESIERHLGALAEAGYPIGAEQRAAVHHLAGGDSALGVCLGAAGSGKTVALRPVAELYRAQGCRVIATALSWRAAVHLASECGVPPLSLARLIRQVQTGATRLDEKTVLLVDEAGMLSVREMRTVLDLAERAGAKVLCIGDLTQLQPIEAGPGLRLLVDELGAARLGTIRRQRPDLEDLLAWDRDLTAAEARANEALLTEGERARLLDKRGDFPGQGWQAKASEAIREGEAGEAIAAYAARGRLHFGPNFESTVERLARDWLRHRFEHPGASRLVIARTHREVRVLSEVLRAIAHPSGIPRPSVTVTTGRGEPGRRKTATLEIAKGDLIRIGATMWDKHLFNGTLVTVDEVKSVPGEDGAPRAWLRATTEDGRQVAFHADEAHDIHGNIRLDYGYALTIASAQGSTADRVFVLTDDRPARETVYPALTRHRDRLDIHVDTEPLALAVRQYRSEEDWDQPVTHEELRAHLARAWSRRSAKEALRDYAGPALRERIAARIAGWEERGSSRHLARLMRQIRVDEGEDLAGRQREDPAGRVLARLRARGGAFSRVDVRRLLREEGVEPRLLVETVAAILAEPSVMRLHGNDATARTPRHATTEVFAAEEALTRLASRLHADVSGPLPPAPRDLARAIDALEPAAAALARTIAGGTLLTVAPAPADRHREAALEAAVNAWGRSGARVLACGATRRSLGAYGRAISDRYTVHELLARFSSGGRIPRRAPLLIVNDAEALDTGTLHALVRLAGETRARLVLVGESRTRCASPAFAWLARYCGAGAASLAAPEHLPGADRGLFEGELEPRALLEHLERGGALRRLAADGEVTPSIVEAWTAREAAHPGETQLVIAPGHREASKANAAIQAARAEAGLLGAGERFDVLRPAFTDPEKGPSNAAAARSREALEPVTVHAGDRIRILEDDLRAGIARGDTGTVVAVSRRRLRILVDGRVRSFNPRRHNRFTLGYGASVHEQPATADHVHAVLDSGSSRPLAFRAATAHRKSLTVHWRARAGETVAELARAIDARSGPRCTQFYLDRPRALKTAHIGEADELRTARDLPSPEGRADTGREDRRCLEQVHEHQRPRDRAHPWLGTATPTSIAAAIRHAAHYRTEGAAALSYEHRYDELTARLSASAERDPRHDELLEELDALTSGAASRAARSGTFRLALPEKTRFGPEDLERHRAECEHELRARRLEETARNPATRVRAWCLKAEDVIERGTNLALRTKREDRRLWFAEGYRDWHASLAPLGKGVDSVARARARVRAAEPGADRLLERFDALSGRIRKALAYHRREEQTAERVRRYREYSNEVRDRYVEVYDNTEGRDGPEQVAYEKKVNRDHQLLYKRADELARDLEWVRPHLEANKTTEREIKVNAEAHRNPFPRRQARSAKFERSW